MACVVSVKKTCLENGRMKRTDIHKLWSSYAPDLHEWMLKLTETFDLTYCVKDMVVVPCLLPDKEPEFEWPDIVQSDEDTKFKGAKIKEFQVLYQFAYVPGGLFNRMQVRLFTYADNSTIWKNGALLKKNNHLALITQSKNTLITVKVQGSKPENIIFLIHEVNSLRTRSATHRKTFQSHIIAFFSKKIFFSENKVFSTYYSFFPKIKKIIQNNKNRFSTYYTFYYKKMVLALIL